MTQKETSGTAKDANSFGPQKDLSPEAERALAEAEARRAAQKAAAAAAEIGGRKGPDPIRYGDWEKGGIASDF